jgi:hypothetical protein
MPAQVGLVIGRNPPTMDDGVPSQEEAGVNQDGRIQSGALVGRSLLAGILILGLPVLLQQILGATVGLVDKMLAGGLHEDVVLPAMDGLGVGAYVGWFIGIAMGGLGIGGQAIISRAIHGDQHRVGGVCCGHVLDLCPITCCSVWPQRRGCGLPRRVCPCAGLFDALLWTDDGWGHVSHRCWRDDASGVDRPCGESCECLIQLDPLGRGPAPSGSGAEQ